MISNIPMLAPGTSIGVAVSGGADSVALLRSLHHHSTARNWSLHVLHVNHKLRAGESDADARFVQDLAAQLGLFCEISELALPPAGNLEQEARLARNDWLCEMRDRHSLALIAQGHTRSDQAETILFRILRGSGGAGLSGIRPTTNNAFIRPLLVFSRHEIREYLQTIGQPWRDDSSNQSLTFARNRIRLQLLPALERDWNPQIEATLAGIADWARAEEEYWAPVIADLSLRYLTSARGGQLCTTEELTALPKAAARRLVRHAISLVKGDLLSIDFAHIEKILALASQTEGSGRLQIPGVDVMRSFDWLRFAPPGTYPRDRTTSISVPIPAEIPLDGGLSVLLLQLCDGNCSYNRGVDCMDRERLPDSLTLRTWQPGDQYLPVSRPSPVKIKTLFQEARIPLWDRNGWPVLTAENAIVWTRKFGVAADLIPSPATEHFVMVEEVAGVAPKSSLPGKHLEPGVVRL